MSVYRTVFEIFIVKHGVTLKPGYGSFKVIENGAVRQTIYDFLLVRYCKYNMKLSCRRDTARSFLSLNILLSHSRSFETTLLLCLVPFLSYLTLNNIVTLKSHSTVVLTVVRVMIAMYRK